MKLVLFFVTVLLSIVIAKVEMKGEFISGFETGVFMRGQPKMLKQYGCKEPSKKEINPALKTLEDGIKPAAMMAKSLKQKPLIMVTDVIQMFLKDVQNLLAVFDDSYKGGNYCSGIIFGMSGADMLIGISQKAIELQGVKMPI
jgi:hypothetical protein